MKPLEYITNLFLRGIDADTDKNLLAPDHSSVRAAYLMRKTINGTYRRVPGDVIEEDRTEDTLEYCTGLFFWETENLVVEFWYNVSNYVKTIYIGQWKVAEHLELPGTRVSIIDAAIDEDDGIMYVIDGAIAPVYYDLMDMLNSSATQKYFTDYNKDVHRLQLVTTTNQPIFLGLEYVGAGSGLTGGGYAYATRFTDTQGNVTNWSPSTPVIPVYEENVTTTPGNTKNGVFTHGEAPGELTNKGIRIQFRVTNEAGFSYMQLKRTAHDAGQSPDFSPNPEYLNLVADANGATVDISSTIHSIIDFVDKSGLEWLPLDEASELESSAIKLAKTVRLVDGRLVLGGVEYEARDLSSLSDSAFIQDGESKRAQPLNMDLGFEGFSKTWNQVYRKNSTRGERFGYAIQFVDDLGGLTFAVPVPGLENYQMPNRRDVMTGIAETLSNLYGSERPEYALYDSDSADSWGRAFEVFSRVWQDTKPAGTTRSPAMLDADGVSPAFDSFQPFYPDGIGDTQDWGFRNDIPCDQMDGNDYNFHQGFNNHIWSLGWAFTGIDTSYLPDWVRGFKIVRTPPADRVLAQGLATYVFDEAIGVLTPPDKEGSKLTFYSPDLDPFYGNKAYLYDDIVNNPSDYQVQLVSALGFLSSAFSGSYEFDDYYSVDLLSYASIYYDSYIYNALDPAAKVGRGSGHVTFGRWRNYLGLSGGNMGAGITSRSPTYLFDIDAVEKINGGEHGTGDGRGNMLELTVDAAIYAQLDTMTKTTGDDDVNRAFHEPVYIVNIVRNNAAILTTNTQAYQDTGVYQKLESSLGTAVGGSGQIYNLVDERWEDVLASVVAASDSDVRYIMVNGQRWMDVTREAGGSISTWGAAIDTGGGLGTGYFTLYGEDYYGMYTVDVAYIDNDQPTVYTAQPDKPVKIQFNVVATLNFYPTEGWEIKVVYNNNSPIIVFGGDSFVGEVFNVVVDNKVNGAKDIGAASGSIQSDAKAEQFQLNGPMPALTYRIAGVSNAVFIPRYTKEAPTTGSPQTRSAYDNERTPVSDIIPDDYDINISNIRQWVFGFICESKSNTVLSYGNTYPRRNYVQRPTSYVPRETGEEPEDYYVRAAVYSDYYDTFGDEYLLWERGGFITPKMLNYDYTKEVAARAVNKPLAGYAERTEFLQRLTFSLNKDPAIQNSPSLRTFLPINYYDLKRADLGEITMLYDAVSGQGRNLYAITEKGIALMLTNKTIMRGAVGEHVSLIDLEGRFMQGEVWLSTSIGCPRILARSKSEGTIETPKGQFVQALTWVNNKGVMLFYNNDVKNIITNWRDTLFSICKGLPGGTNYPTLLTCFNEKENELWVQMSGNTYVFNFFQNNWTHELPHNYDRMLYVHGRSAVTPVPLILGARAERLFKVQDGTYTLLSDSGEDMNPYIEVVINPDLHTSWEFIDYLLHANATPSEMVFDTGASSPNTDTPPVVRDLNPGLYSYIGRRDSGAKSGKAMQGPYLVIRITFDGSLTTAYEVRAIRVGITNIIE